MRERNRLSDPCSLVEAHLTARTGALVRAAFTNFVDCNSLEPGTTYASGQRRPERGLPGPGAGQQTLAPPMCAFSGLCGLVLGCDARFNTGGRLCSKRHERDTQ